MVLLSPPPSLVSFWLPLLGAAPSPPFFFWVVLLHFVSLYICFLIFFIFKLSAASPSSFVRVVPFAPRSPKVVLLGLLFLLDGAAFLLLLPWVVLLSSLSLWDFLSCLFSYIFCFLSTSTTQERGGEGSTTQEGQPAPHQRRWRRKQHRQREGRRSEQHKRKERDTVKWWTVSIKLE